LGLLLAISGNDVVLHKSI